MMYGPEKSDSAIVAVKPANKAAMKAKDLSLMVSIVKNFVVVDLNQILYIDHFRYIAKTR